MIVNRQLKHIHVHVPKTGGMSLLFILQQHKDWKNEIGLHSNLTDIERHDKELFEMSHSFYKTTCIRNPWSHAVSFYYHAMDKLRFFSENYFSYPNFFGLPNENKIQIDTSFKSFVKNSYKKYCQSNYTKESTITFDKWFKYEDWNDMLDFFYSKYNIKLVDSFRKHDKFDIQFIKPLEITNDFRTLYDEESYEIVKRLSFDEIKRFNYTFDNE